MWFASPTDIDRLVEERSRELEEPIRVMARCDADAL